MSSSNEIENYNSYHGIQTVYPSSGYTKPECKTCETSLKMKCAKAAPWVKVCEQERASSKSD